MQTIRCDIRCMARCPNDRVDSREQQSEVLQSECTVVFSRCGNCTWRKQIWVWEHRVYDVSTLGRGQLLVLYVTEKGFRNVSL